MVKQSVNELVLKTFSDYGGAKSKKSVVYFMGGSSGDVSEESVTYEKRKKGWIMSCDVGEATEGWRMRCDVGKATVELENEL